MGHPGKRERYLNKTKEITLKITGCARCRGKHDELIFVPLDIPNNRFTHWTMCPTNLEPILMKVRPK